jgi:protein-tyrosine phosphatase
MTAATNRADMSYVDLHLHLLPGLDDGPPDEAASLSQARRMVSAGVTEAVVTPHVGHPGFRVDPMEIPDRTALLQRTLQREGRGRRVAIGSNSAR